MAEDVDEMVSTYRLARKPLERAAEIEKAT